MDANPITPKSLQKAITWFADYDHCHEFMMALRWPDGKVSCPACGSDRVVYLPSARAWKCYTKHPKGKFTLKTGTCFEDSPIALQKWLPAAWLVINCKNGISSYELGRALEVTQKTAWFMTHRVRLAMQNGSLMKMGTDGGEVEVDETFIGGKARNMHKDRKEKKFGRKYAHGAMGKVAIQGLLDRHGEVRARVVGNVEHSDLRVGVRQHVAPGANVYSDAITAYRPLNDEGYIHQFVDHAEKYVDGKVHTNGLENFWSLLKRGLKGTYVSVEPFHLFRYVDEQSFRYNHRKLTDAERFEIGMQQIVGKRLTFDELTGHDKPLQS